VLINYIEAEDAFEQEKFCYENKDIKKRGKRRVDIGLNLSEPKDNQIKEKKRN
jgi:hypothetical protein